MRNWSSAADSETVCYCLNVDKGRIVAAIRASADTVAKVQAATAAGTGRDCKRLNPAGLCCIADIRDLIVRYAATPATPDTSASDDGAGSCCCCSDS